MIIGISKEYLENSLNVVIDSPDIEETTRAYFRTLLEKLIEECKELNPWLPIDENTPKDRGILLFCTIKNHWFIGCFINMGDAPGYWYSEQIGDQFFPTHWQELPENPKGE